MNGIAHINLSTLTAVFNNMKGRVKYELGSKATNLSADSHTIDKIDCSGFVRFALYRATNGKLKIPDGSWYQRQWCEKNLRRLSKYSDVAYAAKDPSRLFICFIEPGATGKGQAGHVWLVRAGKTMESHGGKGVNSRAWDYKTLKNYCSAAYELPTKP